MTLVLLKGLWKDGAFCVGIEQIAPSTEQASAPPSEAMLDAPPTLRKLFLFVPVGILSHQVPLSVRAAFERYATQAFPL